MMPSGSGEIPPSGSPGRRRSGSVGLVLPVVSGDAEHRKPDWPLPSEEVRGIMVVGLRIENGNPGSKKGKHIANDSAGNMKEGDHPCELPRCFLSS